MTNSTVAASPSTSESDRAGARRAKARERWHLKQDQIQGADRSRKPGRLPKLTEAEQDFLRANHTTPLRTMAKTLGVAPSTVRRYLYQWGLTARQNKPKPPAPQVRPESRLRPLDQIADFTERGAESLYSAHDQKKTALPRRCS